MRGRGRSRTLDAVERGHHRAASWGCQRVSHEERVQACRELLCHARQVSDVDGMTRQDTYTMVLHQHPELVIPEVDRIRAVMRRIKDWNSDVVSQHSMGSPPPPPFPDSDVFVGDPVEKSASHKHTSQKSSVSSVEENRAEDTDTNGGNGGVSSSRMPRLRRDSSIRAESTTSSTGYNRKYERLTEGEASSGTGLPSSSFRETTSHPLVAVTPSSGSSLRAARRPSHQHHPSEGNLDSVMTKVLRSQLPAPLVSSTSRGILSARHHQLQNLDLPVVQQ